MTTLRFGNWCAAEEWPAALERHRAIARAAFARRSGREVGTEGDSFFVVFQDPLDAVEAAIELQVALEAVELAPGAKVRTRIGIHTGPVSESGGAYHGVEVHRAARIAAGGHGGQVLLSEAARTLIGGRLPAASTIRDLGRYRLKDFDVAQTIFELSAPGMAHDFPRLRLDALALTNLPSHRTSFVGRTREIAELRALLATQHLITLVGVGGGDRLVHARPATSRPRPLASPKKVTTKPSMSDGAWTGHWRAN